MNWVNQTLMEFGRGIGIQQLQFDDKRVVQLQLQSGLRLAIEHIDERMLIYVIHMLAFEDEIFKLRALQAADFRRGGAYPLQIGLAGSGVESTLVVLTRLPERRFTLPELNSALDYLCHWVDELQRR